MATRRDKLQGPASDRLEAILERALTAYHRNELHGGARWVGERMLDAELVPVTREAFLDADDLPSDRAVLQVLDSESMQLLGEGYHVIALVEPGQRFVVKYAKHPSRIMAFARTELSTPRSGSTSAPSRRMGLSQSSAASISRTMHSAPCRLTNGVRWNASARLASSDR